MVSDSEVTPNRSRSSGRPRPADGADIAFHSSADVGTTFQVGLSGAEIIARITGLTVSGTGSVRAGTSSDAGAGTWAVPAGRAAAITIAPMARPRTQRSVKRQPPFTPHSLPRGSWPAARRR